MTRTKAAILLALGVTLGASAALFLPASVAAQTGWQCESWTLRGEGDAGPVGTFLGQSRDVLLTSAGLSVSGQSSVVACKR